MLPHEWVTLIGGVVLSSCQLTDGYLWLGSMCLRNSSINFPTSLLIRLDDSVRSLIAIAASFLPHVLSWYSEIGVAI